METAKGCGEIGLEHAMSDADLEGVQHKGGGNFSQEGTADPPQLSDNQWKEEHKEQLKSHADAVYEGRHKELFVTQSAETRNCAASVLSGLLQQRIGRALPLNMSRTSSSFNKSASQQNLVASAKPSSPSATVTRERVYAEKQVEQGTEHDVDNFTSCLLNDGKSTVRDRVPRGQTRRLASMFETLMEAASVEMTPQRAVAELPSCARHCKSVPPPKPVRCDGDVENAQRTTVNEKVAGINCLRGGDDGRHVDFCTTHQVSRSQYLANGARPGNVRSITSRFESILAEGSDFVPVDSARASVQDAASALAVGHKLFGTPRHRNASFEKDCLRLGLSPRRMPTFEAVDYVQGDQTTCARVLGISRYLHGMPPYSSMSYVEADCSNALCCNTSSVSNGSGHDGLRSPGCAECSATHTTVRDYYGTHTARDIGYREKNELSEEPMGSLQEEHAHRAGTNCALGGKSFAHTERERLLQSERNTKNRAMLSSLPSISHLGCKPPLLNVASFSGGTSVSAASPSGPCGNDRNYVPHARQTNDELAIQSERLSRTIATMAECRKKSNFSGALVEVCAQRELLLWCERDVALRFQLEQLRTLQLGKVQLPLLSPKLQTTLDIDSVTVDLSRDFSVTNASRGCTFAFVVVVKSGGHVEATQAVTVICECETRLSTVTFRDPIHFAGLPLHFSAILDVYAMKVRGEEHMDDDLRGVLKNKVESAISPSGSVKSPMRNSFGFLCCGSVILNRDAVGRRRLYLDKVVYPLKGTVELHSHCTPLPPVMEAIVRGYLRMSEDMGCSWARYWTVLHHGMVRFWNCPTDEASEKRPVGCIDLTNCILNKLMPLGRGIHSCPPNTFSVEVLIGSAPKVLTKRMLLSAETSEIYARWIDAINESLAVLRD